MKNMKKVTIEKTITYNINGVTYTEEQIKKHIAIIEATKYINDTKIHISSMQLIDLLLKDFDKLKILVQALDGIMSADIEDFDLECYFGGKDD